MQNAHKPYLPALGRESDEPKSRCELVHAFSRPCVDVYRQHELDMNVLLISLPSTLFPLLGHAYIHTLAYLLADSKKRKKEREMILSKSKHHY